MAHSTPASAFASQIYIHHDTHDQPRIGNSVAALCSHEDLVYSAEVRPGHPSFADLANRGRGMFFIFAQYRLEMHILSERA